MNRNRIVLLALTGAVVLAVLGNVLPKPVSAWSEAELEILRSLSLDSLPALPAAPSNAVADDPRAAIFGGKLFFDGRLSANGTISCATCHQPIRRFTDGLQKAQAIGTTDRHTPSIVGAAYSPWQFWDGRSDSLWSQALAPLEDDREHAFSRGKAAALIAGDPDYRDAYVALFGPMPDSSILDGPQIDTVFANLGKAIAAFERTLLPTESRFDRYVRTVLSPEVGEQSSLFSDDEIRGLRLFIGAANCTQCHNGALLTNHEFHNTGVISFPGETPDKGRVVGVREAMANPFNCRGSFSDDPHRRCDELEFARTGVTLIGAFKTPSLRNLENTAPFMHKGQFATLSEVLQHYNIAADSMIGHNEAKPLGLSSRQLQQLEAFLGTLSAPFASSIACEAAKNLPGACIEMADNDFP